MTQNSHTGGDAAGEAGDAYQKLFASLPMPLLIFDVDTLGVLDVNDAAVQWYGPDRAAFLRLTYRDLFHPEDPRSADAIAVLRREGQEIGDWQHRGHDGRVLHVRTTTHPIQFRGRSARLVAVQDITALRRSDHQLRLLSAALHNAANAILITNENGVIEWVNPAFSTMTGYPAADAVGRNPRDLLRSGKHDAEFYATLWRTVRAGRVWRGRMINRRKDGTLYPEEQTITPVRDGDGRVRHFIAVKEDVTARLRAENALRRSEARYRTLFEGVPIGLFRSTADGRLVDANDAFCRLLGYRDRTSLLRRTLGELFDDPVARRSFHAELDATGGVHGRDVRLRWEDGSRIWARLSVAVERDADGRVQYLEGAVEDVTDRRRNEDHLRFQAQLLDAVDEAVIAADLSGRVQYWNRRAEVLLAWEAEEAMGRDLAELAFTAEAGEQLGSVLDRVRVGERWSGEIDLIRRDGMRVPCHLTAAPMYDEQGRVVGGVTVSRDLRERRLLEQQLRHAQKMEAIGRLAGGVAHDFNNVLTVIQGHAEFLVDGVEDGDLREDARTVLRSAERASRLTQQLLAFSRRQIVRMEVLDLGEAVHELERLLRRVIGEDIALSITAPAGVGRVKADPGQVEQVVLNLAVNARDAMPDGGSLYIGVRRTTHTELDETVPDPVTPGSYLVLEVRDTGTGMDETAMEHLFEPFFTTKPPGEGTGLGLSTVYGIVKQSKGHIAVESGPGRGSTFRIYLPAVEAPVSRPSRLPRPRNEGKGQVILLIEDEDSVRAIGRRILENEGYVVVEASTPREALAAVTDQSRPVDLILTDLVMPEMNGVDLASRLLAERPRTPVVYMSGHAEAEVVRRGLKDDRHRFLPKPFTPADLARLVAEVLAQ